MFNERSSERFIGAWCYSAATVYSSIIFEIDGIYHVDFYDVYVECMSCVFVVCGVKNVSFLNNFFLNFLAPSLPNKATLRFMYLYGPTTDDVRKTRKIKKNRCVLMTTMMLDNNFFSKNMKKTDSKLKEADQRLRCCMCM